MKAAVHTRYGPPEVIRIADVDKPAVTGHEVLVKVHATTVNRTDCGFRAATPFIVRFFTGLIRPKVTVLGSEFAGVVDRGGENVFSVEVENALADAPGVKEVAVLAVPDTMMGEKVGCVVVPSGSQFDVDALLRHAAARLADYKVPKFVATREEPLPRNAAGKVVKDQLREQVTWGKSLR
jgi:acyl-CoA synthetase (AMP-forming)/AMP-acid ligase II